MPVPPTLAIYVPTFEAPEATARLLDSVLPLAPAHAVRIVVGDNSRSEATASVVSSYEPHFGGALTYVRHAANLGMVGNILRAFDAVDATWLWIVSCKDRFLPGALQRLLPALSGGDDLVALALPIEGMHSGFPAGPARYDRFSTTVRDLGFGTVTNLSSLVWRLEPSRRVLSAGYEAGGTLVPHTAMLAAALAADIGLGVGYLPLTVFERLPRGRRAWDIRRMAANLAQLYPDPNHESLWREGRSAILRTHGAWLQRTLVAEGGAMSDELLARILAQLGTDGLGLIDAIRSADPA
jgi:hypothetical protein